MPFDSVLNWWQWSILAAVPPAIIALYFLKLRRQPLEVPSTYLWRKTIEDLHVNSLWQRLRRSLLLLLQLLLLLLIALACLKPSWRGESLAENRVIFLIDTSASMSASDVEPTRLEAARQQVAAEIDRMGSGDVAMIVSFSDRAQVEQPFTDNRRLLHRRLEEIQPTNRTSNISEALRVASGLANPGHSGESGQGDLAAAEPMPAALYILSDGRFPPATDFFLGNLAPIYLKIGAETAQNVAIVAFSTARNPERPDRLQAFARLQNFGEAKTVQAELYLDDRMIDASSVDLLDEGMGGMEFDLPDLDSGTLKLELREKDDLPLDDTAFAAISTPRRSRVLLVTERNDALELALSTTESAKLADISRARPGVLTSEVHLAAAAAGKYDLIIYDRCAPTEMPLASTLFVGSLPPLESWKAGEMVRVPQWIDTNQAHPLMQYVELGDVQIWEGQPLEGPSGSNTLIEADAGPMLVIAPRESFEDVVLGFAFTTTDEEGRRRANTDWPVRRSFPLFMKHVLTYLGGAARQQIAGSVLPGVTLPLRTDAPVSSVTVVSPEGQEHEVARGSLGNFVFGRTDSLGIYQVREGNATETSQRFAVNLFSPNESEIRPLPEVVTRGENIEGQSQYEPTRRQSWKWLLLAGLGVLTLEWYIFNRRVYL